jgi:hypothetical protein
MNHARRKVRNHPFNPVANHRCKVRLSVYTVAVDIEVMRMGVTDVAFPYLHTAADECRRTTAPREDRGLSAGVPNGHVENANGNERIYSADAAK